ALTDDQDRCPRRRLLVHDPADALFQILVARCRPAGVWLPRPAPLLLEAAAVRFQQPPVFTSRNQAAERRLAEVVNEHVLGADEAIPGPANPQGVIVVLEQADLEPFV